MKSRYLGDGVYASFDGYQIWLAANDSENKVIAIEPGVWIMLVQYQHDLVEWIKMQVPPATT